MLGVVARQVRLHSNNVHLRQLLGEGHVGMLARRQVVQHHKAVVFGLELQIAGGQLHLGLVVRVALDGTLQRRQVGMRRIGHYGHLAPRVYHVDIECQHIVVFVHLALDHREADGETLQARLGGGQLHGHGLAVVVAVVDQPL